MSVTEKPRSTGSLSAPMPAPPVRQFSFTDFQVNNPTSPPPGDRLDAEFDRANNAIDDVIDWTGVSLNTDGSIRDGVIGENNLQSDLFDFIASDAVAEVQPLVDQAQVFANAAQVSALNAQASETNAANAASTANSLAIVAGVASGSATTAANNALASQNAAAVSASHASNSDNDAEGAAALAQDYAAVTQAWAEHMPDPIPPNILSVMGVTGSHWSARWWANQAALNVGGPFLLLAGGSMIGALNLASDPAAAMQAATKQYVDAQVAGVVSGTYLPLSGGSLTGMLTLYADPVNALHAATKQYVDTGYLPLAGGSLTGMLTLYADPVSAMHAATKRYVDTNITTGVDTALAGYLPLTGGTLAGPLTVGGVLEVTTGHLQLINNGSTEDAFAYVDLSADIGGMNLIRGHSPGFALTWWTLALGDGPPSADFSITRYNDAGGIIDHPLSISRATGVVTFGPIPPSTMQRLGEAPGVTATAGVGSLQGHPVNGTVIQGAGSTNDFLLNNQNGAAVLSVPAAGTTVNLSGGKISSTVGLGLGSSVLLHVGDAVAANNNPVLMSYKVGAASGALASLGFNNYINALGAGGIRINGAKNGWSIQHDTRTASDGDLGLSVTSSGGVITAPYTFGATGVLTVGNVATTSAVSAPRYQANRTLALTAANDQIANLAVNLSGAYTGSAGNIVSPFIFNIATDTVDAGPPGVVRGVYIQHLFGGSTVKGMREGHHVHLNMTARTANNGLGIFYVGQNITVNGLDNDNGTAVTPSSNLFGFNYIITLGPAATYWNSLIGGEIDIVAKVGSSVVYKCGLQIVNWALDGVQGTLQDTYISLNRHSAATTAMRLGIEFGSPGGWWPIDPAGTMLGTNALYAGSPARLAAFGIDFSQVTFSAAFLKSAGFLVDGSGNLTARAGVYGATVALNGNSGLVFQAGDTVTANSIPLTYSYIVGATSGAIANVGLNAYLNTSGVVARVNAAKNGWLLSQDTRATNDAPLLVRVQSSAGAAATVATFDTAGGLTMAAGVTATAAIFTSLRVNGNAGFNSATPIAKPTVSGAKASNAALASLITALANYGLITDTTTA